MTEEKMHKIHLDSSKLVDTHDGPIVNFDCPRCKEALEYRAHATNPATCKCFTWDLSLVMTGVKL